MKKHHFLVFTILIQTVTALSQETIYDYVELGKYPVGYLVSNAQSKRPLC